MNKIFNINLGGYPFTIDENAYTKLNRYLDKIEDHFSDSEGCDEIIFDIECRMAELFNESLKGQPIVGLKDVNGAIVTMGTPEDFGASSFDEAEETTSRKRSKEYNTGKKLFRDPDQKIIGGVCSGLAAYFGVEDPLWVRLGAVFFFFIGGLALPAYILLWIIVPKARTAGDKLSMRGERIDINNIARTIEDEFDNITETFSELDKKIRSKKKSKVRAGGRFLKSNLARAFGLIGFLALGLVGVAKTVCRPIISLFLILLGLGISISWISAIVGTMLVSPFVSFLSAGSTFGGYAGLMSGLFTIGIPLFGILYILSKKKGNYRLKPNIKSRIWTVWFASLAMFVLSIVNYSMQWGKYSTIESTSEISGIESGKLFIGKTGDRFDDESVLSLDNLAFQDDQLTCNNVRVIIRESDGDVLTVKKKVSGRGAKKSDAFKRINEVNIDELTVKDNKIVIPSYYTLSKGSKFRGQNVTYEFHVPKKYEVKREYAMNDY